VTDVWVVNASPLIVLGKAGGLHLLEAVATTLIVPRSVAREVAGGPDTDAARLWLESEGVACILPDVAVPHEILTCNLGAGESAVLAAARQHPDSEAILDDLAARRAAAALAIPCRGTLAVILTARRRGLIPVAAPWFDRVQQAGLFITPSLRRQALALAGE
jgi:predicted nucleic acid-binding protein